MKIQSVTASSPFYALNSAAGLKTSGNVNFKANSAVSDLNFGNMDKTHYVRVFDPKQEIIDEENYRQELLGRFFVDKKDEDGNLVTDKNSKVATELDPAIKQALDSTVFEFKGPDGKLFEGTIKDAIERFVIYDDNLPERFVGLLHGTSRENIKAIMENGPDMRKVKNSAFGPGMYFALSEGDAQDYSGAKLMADVVRMQRNDGEKGKFVRWDGNFYDKITNGNVISALDKILDIEPEPLEYDPFRPYYIGRVKSEIPHRILDEYCRNVIKDELAIDAGYGTAPGFHSCIVVFNPDSIVNMSDYSQQSNNYQSYYHRY